MSLESQGRNDLDYRRPVLGGSVTLFSFPTSIVCRCRIIPTNDSTYDLLNTIPLIITISIVVCVILIKKCFSKISHDFTIEFMTIN